ncbi:hypothetical protein CN639_16455 [Bacillus toyonensis]|uniref:Uncharacterized protein n=1 Tax=Bacillus toyonensis TaxID=155322 RepID=A0A2B4W9G9_9BACI|nr:hypothetical protein DPQ31_29265 [Bacillus sp. COPE52]PDY86344.1 hypothetical protein CON67_24885 [Bacillus toyonensis]PEO58390.1 hypothetical protein CN560_12765 [Bacillus wiedmannii]PEC08787.1 hypothetical protein CON55_21725 [Bacillus toyonensis]PED92508.1 hypothetical protein CON90_22500 [Bacillus toyonensis]
MYLYETIKYNFSHHFSKIYKAIKNIKLAIRLLDKQKKSIYAGYTNKHIKFILLNLLGEAPIQTQAIAQKCRKTPMGRTGIVGLRLFLR